MYEMLASMVNTNGLMLKGPQNEELKVLPQPLDGSGPPVIGKSNFYGPYPLTLKPRPSYIGNGFRIKLVV